MIVILLAAVLAAFAIFAGDTVWLTVEKGKASIDDRWDPLTGQDSNERYIKVKAGTNVELKGDGHVVTRLGCTEVDITQDTSICDATCTLDPQAAYHKVQISGHYTLNENGQGGSGELVWIATGRTQGSFEINFFPSVRRRYGDRDPG